MKFSAVVVTSVIAAAAFLPEQADAHAFMIEPAIKFKVKNELKNRWSHVVPGTAVPPAKEYFTGDVEKNHANFVKNYKKVNPKSLRDFIQKNARPAKNVPKGGTKECGYSKMNQPPLPIPNAIKFGNYKVSSHIAIHPGPCEAWCDNELVVPFTMDCRDILFKPIPINKKKCEGKSRLTFYWLATHLAPFQTYVNCAPLQGARALDDDNTFNNGTEPATSKCTTKRD